MQSLEERLPEFVGQVAEPPRVARYPVNEAMIRNWVEAHEDTNPAYVDPSAAAAAGLATLTAPPAMVSTWVMAGLRRYRELQRLRAEGRQEDYAWSRLLALLDEHGYTSVVATELEQSYVRELAPQDRVTCHFTIDSISPMKRTALGHGCFLTLHKRYVDQHDALLVEEWFTLLRFDPDTARPSTEEASS